jgi:hypothetical protein
MNHRTVADGCVGRRSECMPTLSVLAAIKLITSLFPRCSDSFVHTLLGQEASATGSVAPSEETVKRLLESHRAAQPTSD